MNGTVSYHLAPHLEMEVVQRGLQQVGVVGVRARKRHESGPGRGAPCGGGALGESLGGDAEHRAWRCDAVVLDQVSIADWIECQLYEQTVTASTPHRALNAF